MRHQLTTWYLLITDKSANPQASPQTIQMVQILGPRLKVGAKPRGLPRGMLALGSD